MDRIDAIRRAVDRHLGNKTKAAHELGITRHAVLRAIGSQPEPIKAKRHFILPDVQACVMGHVQKRDINTQHNALGKRLTAIFAGAYYQHDEDYLGPQGNADTWRGCWMLNEVRDGEFDEMPLSLDYLRRKYG